MPMSQDQGFLVCCSCGAEPTYDEFNFDEYEESEMLTCPRCGCEGVDPNQDTGGDFHEDGNLPEGEDTATDSDSEERESLFLQCPVCDELFDYAEVEPHLDDGEPYRCLDCIVRAETGHSDSRLD